MQMINIVIGLHFKPVSNTSVAIKQPVTSALLKPYWPIFLPCMQSTMDHRLSRHGFLASFKTNIALCAYNYRELEKSQQLFIGPPKSLQKVSRQMEMTFRRKSSLTL